MLYGVKWQVVGGEAKGFVYLVMTKQTVGCCYSEVLWYIRAYLWWGRRGRKEEKVKAGLGCVVGGRGLDWGLGSMEGGCENSGRFCVGGVPHPSVALCVRKYFLTSCPALFLAPVWLRIEGLDKCDWRLGQRGWGGGGYDG